MSSTITQVNNLTEYLGEINKVITGEGSTLSGWYVFYPEDQILLKFTDTYSVDENEGEGIWKDGFLLVGFVNSDKSVGDVLKGMIPMTDSSSILDNLIYYEGRRFAFKKYDGMILVYYAGGQKIEGIETPEFVRNLVDKIEDSTL